MKIGWWDGISKISNQKVTIRISNQKRIIVGVLLIISWIEPIVGLDYGDELGLNRLLEDPQP